MTSHDLLWLLVRRWYVTLLGVVLSLAALAVLAGRTGVYHSQFEVVLIPPASRVVSNTMEDDIEALTPLAGLVVADYNGDQEPLMTSSSETTLFGIGVTQGSQVRLPNRGSQWRILFTRPNIDVQVVDSSPERVEEESQRIVTRLQALLADRQAAIGVAPENRVTALPSPDDPVIAHVAGDRRRLILAMGLLGAVFTVLAVFWIDRLLTHIPPRRRARPSGVRRLAASASPAAE